MPEVIASNSSFEIISEEGTRISEGTVASGTQGIGREITFTVLQPNPTLQSVFLRISPSSEGAEPGDFWETFFTNIIGGEPAEEFGLGTFVNVESGSGQASFFLNADTAVEQDEEFTVSIFDSVVSFSPLLSGTFSIIDDDSDGGGVPATPPQPTEGLNIVGTSFPVPDNLSGGLGDDTISGLAGDDNLTGNGGDDELNGGSGQDSASYSGSQGSYTLTLSRTSTTLEDRRADGNGTDTLISVEFLDFDTDLLGSPFNLTQFGGPTGLSAAEFESFIELYIAYFNRAPDAVGLNFWGTAFANGTPLQEMATLFVDQDETRATYPDGTSNTEFATSVYNNVLGRTPDQSGIDFWVGALDSNVVSRDQFILEVLRGAKADLKPEEGQAFVDQQLADRAYLETKVDIGAYFAVHRGMSDVDNAKAAMALFDGTQNGIDQAVAAIDGFYQQALDPVTGEFLMQVVGVLDNQFA
jgi:hypothetical protein